MVLLSSSKVFFRPTRTKSISCRGEMVPSCTQGKMLIILTQEQADCEGVKFEVSLNGGTTAIQKGAKEPCMSHRSSMPILIVRSFVYRELTRRNAKHQPSRQNKGLWKFLRVSILTEWWTCMMGDSDMCQSSERCKGRSKSTKCGPLTELLSYLLYC